MRLHLVTPSEEILSTAVRSVTVPGVGGEFQVLPGHTFFLTLVTNGELRCETESGELRFTVGPGHAEVQEDTVTVAVESAVAA